MKDIGIWIGSFSTAGLSVFQMENFNPATLAFWETVLGIAIFTIAGGIGGFYIHQRLEKLLNKIR